VINYNKALHTLILIINKHIWRRIRQRYNKKQVFTNNVKTNQCLCYIHQLHTKPGSYTKRPNNDPAQVTQLRKHAQRVITPKLLRVTLRNGFAQRQYRKQAKVSTQHIPMQNKHALRTYTQANITPVSYPVLECQRW